MTSTSAVSTVVLLTTLVMIVVMLLAGKLELETVSSLPIDSLLNLP